MLSLQRLCEMSVARMATEFKLETGQVWKLGTPDEPFDVYIRQAYVDVLPLINRDIDLGGTVTEATRCVVRGGAGVGKTRFVWARIVLYILAMKKGQLDAVSLLLDEMGGHLVTVVRAAVVCPRDSHRVRVYDLGPTFVHAGPVTGQRMRSDVTLSLDARHLRGVALFGTTGMITVPPFTLREARQVASKARPAPIDNQHWERSFRLLGGTLREPFSLTWKQVQSLVDARIRAVAATAPLSDVVALLANVQCGFRMESSSTEQLLLTLVVASVRDWPALAGREARSIGVVREQRYYDTPEVGAWLFCTNTV